MNQITTVFPSSIDFDIDAPPQRPYVGRDELELVITKLLAAGFDDEATILVNMLPRTDPPRAEWTALGDLIQQEIDAEIIRQLCESARMDSRNHK